MLQTRSGEATPATSFELDDARAVRGEYAVRGRERGKLGEQRLLRSEILDDCLDHEVGVGRSLGELGRDREARERGVGVGDSQLALRDAPV